MNQVVHIFRKDCRRLWRRIAAVLALTLLHGYGDVINSGGGVTVGFSPRVLLLLMAELSGLFLPIALFLLVVSVIQEESLVGSDKFWLSRPYNRRSLVLEKLLFVLVWAVLPMLLHDVILIRYFGFSLSSAVGLLLWKTAQFGVFLLIAAALAVLSASFARAVAFGIGIVVLTLLTFSIVMQSSGSAYRPESATYMSLAVLLIAGVGSLLVVAFQYRFRITSVAAAIGVVVILACVLLARFWPQSLTAYWSSRTASPLIQSVQILPEDNLRDLSRPHSTPDAPVQVRAAYYPFQAKGLSDDVGVDLGVSAQFDPRGQKPAQVYSPGQVRFQPPAAGPVDFANPGGPDQLVPFALANSDDFERLQNADGTISGKLILLGFRTTAARVSLPAATEVRDLSAAGRKCEVRFHPEERNLTLIFDCVELEPGNTTRFRVRLLQNNQQITPSQTQGQDSSEGGWPGFLSPIVRTGYVCQFPQRGAAEDPAGNATAGREILVFAEEGLGKMERDFRIEHFRPAESSLQAWEQRGVVRPAE